MNAKVMKDIPTTLLESPQFVLLDHATKTLTHAYSKGTTFELYDLNVSDEYSFLYVKYSIKCSSYTEIPSIFAGDTNTLLLYRYVYSGYSSKIYGSFTVNRRQSAWQYTQSSENDALYTTSKPCRLFAFESSSTTSWQCTFNCDISVYTIS